MQPKPKHLGSEYGAQFQDASVVAAYGCRPPYPAQVFDLLSQLVAPQCSSLLDLGCGPGPIARGMLGRVERIHALDWSAAMVAAGRRLPGGDAPTITWTVGRAEDAPLYPPYGIIVAGASLHWMDWQVVMPRLRAALAPGAYIAIVEEGTQPAPWHSAVGRLCAAYSTNRDYQPYRVIDELSRRGLFRVEGSEQTPPLLFVQTLEDYVESFHARNGFSRDRMTAEAAQAFDQQVRDLVLPHALDGQVTLAVFATVVWGK